MTDNAHKNDSSIDEKLLPKIVMTGGSGNLATKLSHHLLNYSPPKYRVHLIEHPKYYNSKNVHPKATVTLADIGDMEADVDANNGKKWIEEVFGDTDCLIHFSAVNPYPNATWDESSQSMDHIFNIFIIACCKYNIRRILFATSNHVMGQYKDDKDLKEGELYPYLQPKVGTPLNDPIALQKSGDAIAYASAKLAGERLASTLAAIYAPQTTFVCLRIGWCQPNENLPSTLSSAGVPAEYQKPEESTTTSTKTTKENEEAKDDIDVDDRWFKSMWLSNNDFISYFEAAIHVHVPLNWEEEDDDTNKNNKRKRDDDKKNSTNSNSNENNKCNPHRHLRRGFLLLNAMSRNKGAKWDLKETEKILNVTSKDDSYA